MAKIKITNKVAIIDESTKESDFHTGKTIYPEGEENVREKPAKSFKKNFLAVLGFNVESALFVIKNLDEFEFAKSLFRLKRFYSDTDEDKIILDKVIGKYNLSKKQLTKKIEEKEDNPNFLEKIKRSMKNNKNDKSMVLARKIGKHCKRESTENPKTRKQTMKKHVFDLIEEYNIEEQFKNDRLVLLLDNAKSHTSTFVKEIAKKLNIELVPLPKYSPWLNCVEKVWAILKYQFNISIIRSSSELIQVAFKTFKNKMYWRFNN